MLALVIEHMHLVGVVEQPAGLVAQQRVVFMADGQIVEENTPEKFFTDPQSERAKDFLGKILKH